MLIQHFQLHRSIYFFVLFKAVSEGKQEIDCIAISADLGEEFVGPCGMCRYQTKPNNLFVNHCFSANSNQPTTLVKKQTYCMHSTQAKT